ncbi:methylaspartate mutase [Candidatus Poribacteria bacterium]|nr:methylaspartate mutase [Candidatus Poribacteria bacterium]
MNSEKETVRSILATDCGSTTTKAILIEHQPNGEYHLTVRGEAPTTVEAPVEDVTAGVINAVTEVQELADRRLLDDNQRIIKPQAGNQGVDLYISTSSAGGGLQMMVAGVVRNLTAESAERAALGAGAIVMDIISSNDGRLPHEKIDRIRQLRPDMLLLSGGTDGGTTTHVAEMAEILAAANPQPRLGTSYQMPVIYAGNREARGIVADRLEGKMSLEIVDNLRPVLEEENLMPTRLKIQDQFLEHVMAHAPGYKKLMSWADVPIMPTPGAVGAIIQTIADQEQIQVVGVDIGGATTDVFSVFRNREDTPVFNRTVSANLGMSYSISNVVAEAGIENVLRWLRLQQESSSEVSLGNQIKNKMIRPTTIPQTISDLILEQAIAREALRLAFAQHKSLAVELRGVQQQRTISDAFDQTESGRSLVDLLSLDLLVGSGGVLSHAPRRQQAMMMMIDGFQPEGFTQLAVDSIFMMPQLGVLAQVNPDAATQVFKRDCLIHLGPCLAPVGSGGRIKMTVNLPTGTITEEIEAGQIRRYPLDADRTATIRIEPNHRFDVGAGQGMAVERQINGGIVGLVVDTRGRPLDLSDQNISHDHLTQWAEAMDLYPA